VAADPIERVDRLIERLNDALSAVGFEPLAPAAEGDAVAEIERAVAPLALPADLARFWERCDFSSLTVTGWTLPEPCTAQNALATHRQNLSEVPLLFGPPLLFPVARSSGDQWSIELGSRWSPGGTVVSQPTGTDTWRIEYASFTDLLDVYAELLEEGRFKRWDNGLGSFTLEDERARQEQRLDGAREIGAAREQWPAHWLEMAGLDLADREPLGATHSIAALLAEAQQRPAEGRIRGKVVRLGGSSDGVLALVSNGDDAVLVFCPASATTWGPASGGSYEFDVVVPTPPPAGDDNVLFDGHRPAAVARAVRPIR
jgi:hypothetical protein